MKKRRITRSRVLLAAFMTATFISQTAMGDTIRLKSSVHLSRNDHIVTLGDIAELSGPMAEQMAELVVMTLNRSGAPKEITIRSVRAILNEAGIHWGRIQLSGKKVFVHPAPGPGAGVQPLIAMNGASLIEPNAGPRKSGRTESLTVQSLLAVDTVRGEVAAFFARTMRISPEELQLTFHNADAKFLDIARQAYRIEIESLSSLKSDRVNLTVRLWEGVRIEQRRSISVDVLLHKGFVEAAHDISRHDVLVESDLQMAKRWMPPSEASLTTDIRDAVGRVSSKHIKAGEPIRHNAINRRTLVRRGDPIIVRCLVGGTVISIQAEARGVGSEGDIIEFRKKGERETFFATITAHGEAIIDLSNANGTSGSR